MSQSSEPAQPEPGPAGKRPPRCTGRATPRRPAPPRQRPAHGRPCTRQDRPYELTDEDRAWARRAAAALGPLTSRQRDILALLLRPCR